MVRVKKESAVRKLFRKGYIETLLFIHEKGKVFSGFNHPLTLGAIPKICGQLYLPLLTSLPFHLAKFLEKFTVIKAVKGNHMSHYAVSDAFMAPTLHVFKRDSCIN